MLLEWYYPPVLGGQTSGLNDSGVSYFEADPIRSVAKETLQDSLDAVYKEDEKVIVKYKTFEVDITEIPNYIGLQSAFRNGVKRWEHHKETKKFFEKGFGLLQDDKIQVLAIQDYNTTGLSKVGNQKTGGWYTLILASGVTEKSATDGGSYGIGKNAPFAASGLRTVLYNTINRDEEIGFQGVSKIPTFKREDGEETQGTGFYFNVTNKQPITKNGQIPKVFRRTDYGTDKFIIGFNDFENWKERLVDEVISTYLLAIKDDRLEVYIDDIKINSSTLHETIKLIKKFNPNSLALQYYEVLNSNHTKMFQKEFKTIDGMYETIHLSLLERDGFKKRVGLHRSTGMKIDDKGHFHTPIDFSGVLFVEGEKLNEALRKMEPPTHDKWKPGLYKENEIYAEDLITKMNQWMNSCARSLLEEKKSDNIQIKGIEELLPNHGDDTPKSIQIKKEAFKETIKSVSSNTRKKRKRISGRTEDSTGISGEVEAEGDKKNQKQKKKTNKKQTRRASISRVNVYCQNVEDKIYTIIFDPRASGELSFNIKAVGENGKSSNIDLVYAKYNNEFVSINKNVIGPIMISEENAINYIEIQIDSPNRLALDVIQE